MSPSPTSRSSPVRSSAGSTSIRGEALLVIEVSDSSLPTDRLSKAAIYAAAGIPQYLVVNLPGDRVEVFGNPDTGTATWANVRPAYRGERIELLALSGLSLSVEDLLPRT